MSKKTKTDLEQENIKLRQELGFALASLESYYEGKNSQVKSPHKAFELIGSRFDIENFEQEHFFVIFLDARQNVLDVSLVALGTLAEVGVHPRDVFREAIRQNVHSIVLAHNHISGDLSPSPADMEITKRMVQVGKMIGISVLDHLIFTASRHMSFAAHGLMPDVDGET